ncbi:phosphoenolpyruvate carboxylase [Porphyromonas sp. COT-239 OH1446]|uniref:phosphoenolpyruvate carboxylase n=1 Tax=Porphyromonas sp. COT-239 OH1446 TaxID=1515613 RepID=UPI00052CC9E5|nr:phosphoenolpyruvate carboxylase [Porphyromonas sp. COT-239 OH1446]KGN71541.1 phosphoenolpyruvate carboxylase [Porphyromonas sp. COT-239 OH1446]
MKQDQTNRISDNVVMLGELLTDTVRKALGEEMTERIERIRELSHETTTLGFRAENNPLDCLETLSDQELLHIAQTFNQSLNLLNTAEQFNAISLITRGDSNPIRFVSLCGELKAKGCSREEIITALEQMNMDLVLTAHPTEINRRSFINNLNETSECLEELERADLPEYKRAQLMRRLRQLIVQYWYTDEIRKRRPTPIEEAKWGNDVIENSLWHAVPSFIRELNVQLEQTLEGYTLPIDARPIQFTAWMGGDRDGNPNVTATVTREVLLQNRKRAAQLFLADIEVLVRELSMSKCTEEFRAYLGDQEVQEPYRELMKRLRSQLRHTIAFLDKRIAGKQGPISEEVIYYDRQLWEPLMQCYHSLIACGMDSIAGDKLTDTLRRICCFGVTLVRTDVRQESSRHAEAISEITRYIGLGDYMSWSEEEKQAFLIRELSSKRPLIPSNWTPSPETAEVLETCRVIAETPEGVIPVYLISMTQTPSDILAVHLLLKETNCPYRLPVGPLFETLADLKAAASVMRDLFHIGWYRGIIDNRQMVMIGYSDSAKDAGALAAGWAQYCAQEELIEVCREAGVQLTLFHGRGGTIGRGGGPAKRALFSQPPGSLQGGLRVTVQGEMIRFKFGQPAIAIHTLDLYLEAILEANLLPPPVPQPQWRAIMDELRDSSCQIYQGVVRRNPDFISYFYQATPEAELAKLPMGSRPAKRRSTPSLESLRAIPWIFGWAQNRLMLPAWLGAGEALQQAIDQGQVELLETMYREWPFFNSRISMLEMVYAKSDIAVAEYYDRQLVAPELQYLGDDLRERLRRDIETILSISHDAVLMEDVSDGAADHVQMRSSYTLPLNLLQVELLRRSRATDTPSPALEQALMVTISGIAAGVRNSG